MVTKIHIDSLRSEIDTIRALLERSAGRDPLGSRSLQRRLQTLENELREFELRRSNIASVALVFDGRPVRGSSAIEADFAGKALQDYQELIAKHVASEEGPLAERGRLSQAIHKQARMNVTGLMYGSFGFLLEEDNSDQFGMFESPAQKAVQSVTDLLQIVTANDGDQFDAKLDDLDIRIFHTLKRFIATLHRAGSTLRLAEPQREISFDSSSVERAFERVSKVEVEEIDETLEGDLLGLVPVQRRFDFRRSDSGEILQGRVAISLSADYLERIERDGLLAGTQWRATIRTKTVHHPDGRHTSILRTLIDLIRP